MELWVLHELKQSRCSRGAFLIIFGAPTPQPPTALPGSTDTWASDSLGTAGVRSVQGSPPVWRRGPGREAEAASARGRLAAISGPSQAPSPDPVFIPPPRLLTRVADTRPVWPRPQARWGRQASGSLPGGSHGASPRAGRGRGRAARRGGRGTCVGAQLHSPPAGDPRLRRAPWGGESPGGRQCVTRACR